MSTFRDRVINVVRAIPPGRLMTYGEVAQAAGKLRAARAVGAIMRANKLSFIAHANDPNAIPCHRVVAAKYRLGGFNAGTKQKQQLLRKEGWSITKKQKLERHV